MSQLSATIGVLATLAQTLTVPTVAARRPFRARPAPPARPRSRNWLRRQPIDRAPSRSGPQVADVQLLPRVVCGMVVVPVDPAVDPHMVKPAPSDVTFNMRVVKPPVCLD